MLGKLFSRGSGPDGGSGAGPPSPSQPAMSFKTTPSALDSRQEDMHTRNLLFPDLQELFDHRLGEVFPFSVSSASSGTNAYDYNSDLELEDRHVRVIMMQDAMNSFTTSLLYDSQAPPPNPSDSLEQYCTAHTTIHETRRSSVSPRKPSLATQRTVGPNPSSPQLRQSAFDRRPSMQGRSSQTYAESDAQRAWREYREELATLSSCIFGHSELMAYKGTSTKVHVVPSEPQLSEFSKLGDGRGSLGRSSMRSSRLSQSFSSDNVPSFPMAPTATSAGRSHDRKKVLVTRLFPVILPTGDDETPQDCFLEDSSGFPFPRAGEEEKAKKKKTQVKQKRTPMYAVALVINLPSSQSGPSTNVASSRAGGYRGSNSYTEADSFPASYNSAKGLGWAAAGSGLGLLRPSDSFDSNLGSETEDRLETITQHWDVIMRTLTHLQSVVASTLSVLLKQADLTSPDSSPASSFPTTAVNPLRTPLMTGRRSEDGFVIKPSKTNAKNVALLPNCLAGNRHIAAEVDRARTRIVNGLRATRVVTGQNRWPIWREEARWVSKWCGGHEQQGLCFFDNLLTAFLATHVDWLQALAPSRYRRRLYQRQKNKLEEDASVPARTLIIGSDKMAARRLIFLLSAFLPAAQQLLDPRAQAPRPTTSASLGATSESPPSIVVPILKEESLRRKINRRSGPRLVSRSRNVSFQTPSTYIRAGGVPPALAHLSMEGGHVRRASDASAIRAIDFPLPLLGGHGVARKSSTATTATVTPETSLPHFSTAGPQTLLNDGPERSSSVATDDLRRLAREDSASSYSTISGHSRRSSRWDVLSGLWSPRRRESTCVTLPSEPSFGSSPNSRGPPSPTRADPRAGNTRKPAHVAMASSKLSSADSQVETPPKSGKDVTRREEPMSLRDDLPAPRAMWPELSSKETRNKAETTPKTTPEPAGPFDSPVKTTINMDDGVIDVDVPFPEYITSFETAVSSPSSSGYLSTPGLGTALDAFEQSCRVTMDGDATLNVAGWLQQYHPDFAVQALPASQVQVNSLIDQVKASMRAEPHSSLGVDPELSSHITTSERWVDVSTALIADIDTFTITRLRYRRPMRPVQNALSDAYSSAAVLLSPSISPNEFPVQGQFVQETLTAFDNTFAEAVEKVIAVGGAPVSTIVDSSSSASWSLGPQCARSNSTPARTENTRDSHRGALSQEGEPALPLPTEVPRSHCKTILLSALEDIVREVVEQRDCDLGQDEDSMAREKRSRELEGESILREAVRTWFDVVDSFGI